jgi:signal-transduction protein with cAMP-binding, CBS, and nucleotidyltransferase domain|tara:strand:+ start:137 stop:565 length:429 start_codon:yes stop_codon:yes gene_type:complete
MPGKLVSMMSKRKCFTLTEVDTIKTASQNLHEKKIGSMPILDKSGKVIGIISERDLSQFIYTERFNINLSVTKIMSTNLVSCDLNTSVTELMDIMTNKKIRHILIIEDRKLLGIVSIGDVVDHLINKIKEENESLREYINSY